MSAQIALVDEHDKIIGYTDKTEVHQKGLLHRAFSIIIFNSKGEMLIHRRAFTKYHSAGLWTNACCSHLAAGNEMEEVIHERLLNEMGFDCELKHCLTFHYRVVFDNNLTENEIDWVYQGIYDGKPLPNPDEVDSYRWITIEDLVIEIRTNPQNFTYWFKHIISNYLNQILKND